MSPLIKIELYAADVAEWNIPTSGFFLWIRLKKLRDVRNLALNRCLRNLIITAPGYNFFVNDKEPCPYLRLCFSMASEEDVNSVVILQRLPIFTVRNLTISWGSKTRFIF